MPALPPGITRIDLPGRKGRNGKRTPSWCYEAKAYNPRTKRTEYVGRYPNVSDAKEAKRRFEEANGAKSAGATRMTVETLVETLYLQRTKTLDRKPREIKRSTISTNRYAIRPFVARFGSTRVDRLDEDEVVRWCRSQPGYVVEGTRAMFKWAVDARLVKSNPMIFVRSCRGNGRKDLQVISTEDLNRLVAAAKQCWPGPVGRRIATFLVLLAYSGMRPSEAFALRREHLDLDDRRIALDWQLDDRGDPQPLKNSRKRQIAMDPAVCLALQQLLPEIHGNDLLFRTAQGKRFNCKSKWNYYWNPIRRSVGLASMDVYELRHYCATILIDNGASPELVAKQLGHSDGGDLVRKLYGHPDDELMLDRLDEIMRNRTRTIRRRLEAVPPAIDEQAERDEIRLAGANSASG